MCRWLFYSTHVRELRALYPDNPRLAGLSEETRLIVSEPLSDRPGVWNEITTASKTNSSSGEWTREEVTIG